MFLFLRAYLLKIFSFVSHLILISWLILSIFLIVTDLNLTVLFNIAQFFSNGKFKIIMCLSSAKTSKEVEHNTE